MKKNDGASELTASECAAIIELPLRGMRGSIILRQLYVSAEWTLLLTLRSLREVADIDGLLSIAKNVDEQLASLLEETSHVWECRFTLLTLEDGILKQ